jgi:hydroxypyruvate isomerase
MKRRQLLSSTAKGLGAITIASCSTQNATLITDNAYTANKNKLKGEINHSVCKWCYRMPLEELAEAAQEIGLKSIEIINPDEWGIIKKYGLECGMSNGSNLGIPNGFNEPGNHVELLRQYTEIIPKASDFGVKQIICFSGNRNGMSDEDGLENCAVGLEPIIKLAEKHDVIISMELLNSKVDHKDYMCDHTSWGVALVEKVASPNFKLLYDIYHMQIMEGDVIRTIQDNHKYISHYHTGGVPGRNEINDTQELYYPAIIKAIKETGYTGFIGQEFIPKGPNPIESLEEGVHICDV